MVDGMGWWMVGVGMGNRWGEIEFGKGFAANMVDDGRWL